MKNNLFDVFVKEKMSGYKPDVPSHIWDNIAANNGKKKPLVFWLSPLGRVAAAIVVLLTTVGVGGYYFSTKKTAVLPNDIVKTTEKNTTKNELLVENEIPSNTEEQPEVIKEINKIKTKTVTIKNIIEKNITPEKEQIFSKDNNKINTKASIKINSKTAEQVEIIKNDIAVNTEKSLSVRDVVAEELQTNIFSANNKLNKQIKPFGFSIPCPEAEENAAGNKKYIEVYAGPDYVFKSFEDTGSAYIEKRKASTALFYAYTAGVRYTKVFASGVSVKIGANYSQINERFFAKNGYELSRVFTVNNLGDTTSNYFVSTPKYEKSTNVYRSVDIPLQMGYEMGNGKFHGNISAGVNINIVSSQKGNVIDQAGLAVNIGSDDAKATKYKNKTNAGISFLGSATLYYKIRNKLHLLAEPYIRYGLSPSTKSELTLKQRTHTAGLRLGLRKDL
jgi:hypothetical protein